MSEESQHKLCNPSAKQDLSSQSTETRSVVDESSLSSSRSEGAMFVAGPLTVNETTSDNGNSPQNGNNENHGSETIFVSEKPADQIAPKSLEAFYEQFVMARRKARAWFDDVPPPEIRSNAEQQHRQSLIVEPGTPVPDTGTLDYGRAGWRYSNALFGDESGATLRRGESVSPLSQGSDIWKPAEQNYCLPTPVRSPFQERSPISNSPSITPPVHHTTLDIPLHPYSTSIPYPAPIAVLPLQVPRMDPLLSDNISIPSAFGPVRHGRNSTLKEEKKFLCSVCSKPFLRPSALKVHFRIHTGERPYLCPDRSCLRSLPEKAFSVKSNWLRHVKKLHPEFVLATPVSL